MPKNLFAETLPVNDRLLPDIFPVISAFPDTLNAPVLTDVKKPVPTFAVVIFEVVDVIVGAVKSVIVPNVVVTVFAVTFPVRLTLPAVTLFVIAKLAPLILPVTVAFPVIAAFPEALTFVAFNVVTVPVVNDEFVPVIVVVFNVGAVTSVIVPFVAPAHKALVCVVEMVIAGVWLTVNDCEAVQLLASVTVRV